MAMKDKLHLLFHGKEKTSYSCGIKGIRRLVYAKFPDEEFHINLLLTVIEQAAMKKDFDFFYDTIYTHSCKSMGLNADRIRQLIFKIWEKCDET